MQLKFHMVTIEDLVPEGHFLRRLEQALDLSFVYEETVYLYSRKYGRPPIDPVVLVKYLLVGYLYGIPSERQIEQRIQTDVALRWYLGLDLFDRVPDHSTISQLRRRKPAGKTGDGERSTVPQNGEMCFKSREDTGTESIPGKT